MAHCRFAVRAAALAAFAAFLAAEPATAQPVFLASYGNTLFRVTDETIETFPGQPASIIGMTVIPPGSAVASASAGDVLAIEGSGGTRIWRVDNPISGTPDLVLLGNFPSDHSRGDITFAHGRLFGINAAVIYEYSVDDFSLVNVIDLERPSASSGGIVFDGDANWYIANQASERIVRLLDPPSADGWTPLEPTGIDIGNNDLEWYFGALWLATDTDGVLRVGTIDLDTGVYQHVLGVAPTTTPRGVGLAVINSCPPDLNGDGTVNSQDFIRFLNYWTAAHPIADWNRDGVVNSLDFLAFLNAWIAGC